MKLYWCGNKWASFIIDNKGSSLVTKLIEWPRSKGYDQYFDSPLESQCECPVCLLGLREPVQTSCGHRFWRSCIVQPPTPIYSHNFSHLLWWNRHTGFDDSLGKFWRVQTLKKKLVRSIVESIRNPKCRSQLTIAKYKWCCFSDYSCWATIALN